MDGILIDIGHSQEGDQSYIDLYIRGKKLEVIHEAFDPYFYFDGPKPAGGGIKKAEKEGKWWKVTVASPSDVPKVREQLKKQGSIYEFDIPYTQRFLIDRDVVPLKPYHWQEGGGRVKVSEANVPYAPTTVAFDIETYNPRGMPDAEMDPIVMISTYGKSGRVYTWKDIRLPFVKSYSSEKGVIEAFLKDTSEDIIYTYNGDNFDLPYLKKRMEALGISEDTLGKVSIRAGMRGMKARIAGRTHFDVYRGMMFLARIGALKLPRYTLEDVYKEFTGKEKLDIDTKYLWKIWDSGTREQLEELATYSFQDAEATYELGEHLLPLYTALSQMINQMPFDVSRMSSSQVVESLLMKMAFKRGEHFPNKPGEGQFKARVNKPVKGAFVRQPKPGLHNDIAVLDFRGLYPSIIISHNIDPSTLNAEGCSSYYKAPTGQRFCKDRIGLIPEMLKRVTGKRAKIKVLLKKEKEGTRRWKQLYAEQQALKIAANSTYGYMNFARARWYSHDCAEATTAWGRKYIKQAAAEAEKRGFKVIYGDTDSVFLLRGGKSKGEVMKFLADYNDSLPEEMELEFEGFYPRGIFVTKKGGIAAKKRYALIREDGQVEIKGLEFVRRDWSQLAKKTQQQVIQLVLEGKAEEAKQLVRDMIGRVRRGEVPLDDYIIKTQLKRNIGKYASTGPHVRAAMRLKEAGEDVKKGAVIEYIVVEGAGKIGDRSYPVRILGSRKPDKEYYISHQLLPAVMKILSELGVTQGELLGEGKQTGLWRWAPGE